MTCMFLEDLLLQIVWRRVAAIRNGFGRKFRDSDEQTNHKSNTSTMPCYIHLLIFHASIDVLCSWCICFNLGIIIYTMNIYIYVSPQTPSHPSAPNCHYIVKACSQIFQCILGHWCLNLWYSINDLSCAKHLFNQFWLTGFWL